MQGKDLGSLEEVVEGEQLVVLDLGYRLVAGQLYQLSQILQSLRKAK